MLTGKAPRNHMAQSVDATQEIQLEDIVEMSLALTSSVELGDDDLIEEPVAVLGPPVPDAEDLVATRIQPSRMTTHVTTAVMATLRVPSLTLAQAMSALASAKDGAKAQAKDSAEKTQPIPRHRFGGALRQLPAPIWASISAAVAALVVGSAALAATQGSDDSVSVQVRVAEREEPQSASKAMRRKYTTSEQLGRWSEVPNYMADVSVEALPKR